MKKKRNGVLSIFLALFLMTSCSPTTYTHNIQINNNKPNIKGEDNLFEYGNENEFEYVTPEDMEKENGLNIPSVKRYAPKWVYSFLGENVMPIGGFVEPDFSNPEYALSIEESMLDFKESGCNLLNCQLFNIESKYTKEMIKYAEDYGFMMLVKYSGLSALASEKDETKAINNMKNDLAEISSYKSFAGLHVVDEPGYLSWIPEINGVKNEKAIHGKLKTYFQSLYNSRLYFINLLPIYSPSWAFPNGATGSMDPERNTDYEFYYNTYMKYVNPQVFMYDYYPMVGAFPGMLGDYFHQITIVKNLCENQGIPFWCYTQVADWGGGRDVTYNEIAWQVNTGIALGAKGFMYYVYHNNSDHTNAPIEKDGTKGRSYNDIQKVNNHISTVDEWVLNGNVKALIQSGIMPNGEILSPKLNLVKKYKHINSSSGVAHLISCMDYYENNVYDPYKKEESKELYYVVNNTITDNGDVTINFTKPVEYLYRINNKEYKGSGDSLTVELMAGEGFALRILGEL